MEGHLVMFPQITNVFTLDMEIPLVEENMTGMPA